MGGMIDRRLENQWDREFEQGLPDSRTKDRKTVFRARMQWEAVYCANCGKLHGLVTPEFTPHIFFVCDICFYKMNKIAPPGMTEGSPPLGFEVVNGRIEYQD